MADTYTAVIPYESLDPLTIGASGDESKIYRETLEIVLQGLQSDVLEHRGPRYTYRKVPMILKPLQKPHPPLWYGLGHMAGAEWAATNRVNVITNLGA